MKTEIEFTRINNDTNGNPRYVCHFTNFLTENDRITIPSFDNKYQTALKRAKNIGGKKFHNKQYGGGIIFQSYNIQDDEKRIKELMLSIE